METHVFSCLLRLLKNGKQSSHYYSCFFNSLGNKLQVRNGTLEKQTKRRKKNTSRRNKKGPRFHKERIIYMCVCMNPAASQRLNAIHMKSFGGIS